MWFPTDGHYIDLSKSGDMVTSSVTGLFGMQFYTKYTVLNEMVKF